MVVGCGAIGCAAADLLCRAGVGRLTLIDRDVVEWTNLQRQCLFDEADAREGLPKAEAARRRLNAIHGAARIDAVIADITPANAVEVCVGRSAPGVLLDGTDNYETRYLLNDLAVREGVVLAYAGAVGAEGMAMTVRPGRTPCLRCVFPEPPPVESRQTCDTSGVFGPAVALAASWQAGEALKILMGREDLLSHRLLRANLERGEVSTVSLPQRPDAECPCCAHRRFEWLDRSSASATTLCGRSSVQVAAGGGRVDLDALASRLGRAGEVTSNRFLVRAALADEHGEQGSSIELTVFADGRAIVSGTTRADRARSIVAKYVG